MRHLWRFYFTSSTNTLVILHSSFFRTIFTRSMPWIDPIEGNRYNRRGQMYRIDPIERIATAALFIDFERLLLAFLTVSDRLLRLMYKSKKLEPTERMSTPMTTTVTAALATSIGPPCLVLAGLVPRSVRWHLAISNLKIEFQVYSICPLLAWKRENVKDTRKKVSKFVKIWQIWNLSDRCLLFSIVREKVRLCTKYHIRKMNFFEIYSIDIVFLTREWKIW